VLTSSGAGLCQVSPLHQDGNDNVVLQLTGRKKFVLFHPLDSSR
jgi:hypothetical protein